MASPLKKTWISQPGETARDMDRLLETTTYSPEVEFKNFPKDEFGMTIVEPEPDDPDDE